MLKAIRTRFYGAINTRPRRVIASDSDGHTFTVTDGMVDNTEGQYESMHEIAAKSLMAKMKWDNQIVNGGYGNDQYWVMLPKDHGVMRTKWEFHEPNAPSFPIPHPFKAQDLSNACAVCGKIEGYIPFHVAGE